MDTIPRPKDVIVIHQDLFFSLFTVEECVVSRSEKAFHLYQPIYYDTLKKVAITTSTSWDRLTQWLPKIDYNWEHKYDEYDYYMTDGCRHVSAHNY